MSKGRFSREVRILLIGRTGHGKSSTGNSILGAEVFKVSAESQSCTRDTETGERERFGYIIRVTDTPGFFDTDMSSGMSSQAHLRRMLLKCVGTLMPGLDAICFVIRKGERFTPELQDTRELFFEWFGNAIENYAYTIVTYCASQDDAERYFQSPHTSLRCLREGCQGRVFPIDNQHAEKDSQIRVLIDKIVERKRNDHWASHQDVKTEIIQHIAKTMPRREMSYDSLNILKLFDEEAERIFRKVGFRIKESEAYGPIQIIDVSKSQTGIYIDSPETPNQYGSSSPDVERQNETDAIVGNDGVGSIIRTRKDVDENPWFFERIIIDIKRWFQKSKTKNANSTIGKEGSNQNKSFCTLL